MTGLPPGHTFPDGEKGITVSKIDSTTHNEAIQRLAPRRDYSAFKFVGSNRDIAEYLVENIAEDLDQINLLDCYPLVVDSQRRIYDGQHRHKAASGMLVPFYALCSDDLDVADIANTNQATAIYSYEDYLHVYSALNFEPYMVLRDFMEKNPHLQTNKCIRLLNYGNGKVVEDFKAGLYAVTSLNFAELVAQRTRQFVEMFPGFSSTPYINALAELSMHARYDHDRMMNRLSVVPTRVRRVSKLDEAYAVLSEIYNYNSNASNRILLSRPTGEARVYPCQEAEKILSPEIDLNRSISNDKRVSVETVKDLSRLKRHYASRQLLQTRLSALEKSIRAKNLLSVYPVICTEEYEILDGSLRVEVARKLGLPVSVIRVTDVSILHIARASGKRKEWRLPDFFKMYMNEGHAEYKKLHRLIGSSKVKESSLSSWVVATMGVLGESKEYFKDGLYECRYPNFALWFMSCLDRILSAGVPVSLALLSRTVANLLCDPQFSLDELVQKTEVHGPRLWETFSNIDDGISVIESAYNYRRKNKVVLQRQYTQQVFSKVAEAKERQLSAKK